MSLERAIIGCVQVSVLGPLEFAAYKEDITDLTDRHDLGCSLSADDTQRYDIVIHPKFAWL